MNESDMERLALSEGETVDLVGRAGDGIERIVRGFRATVFDVPRGSCAGYLSRMQSFASSLAHAERSHVPAAKSIPVEIRKSYVGQTGGTATLASGH